MPETTQIAIALTVQVEGLLVVLCEGVPAVPLSVVLQAAAVVRGKEPQSERE
jgi:hypothetical protein